MTVEQSPKNGHDVLISVMQRNQYQAKDSGTCAGVAYMGAQALLAHDLPYFCALINAIISPAFSLSVDGHDTDARPLLEGIQIFQGGIKHYFHLLDATIANAIERVAAVNATARVEKKGGLTHAHRHDGIYTLPELSTHLASMREMVQSATNKPPFAFILSSLKHAVCISYDCISNHWILIDANHLPALKFNSDIELTHQLSRSFWNELLTSTNALTTDVLTLGLYKDISKTYIQSWRHSKKFKHANHVDTRKAMMIDDEFNCSLLSLAVEHSDERLVHHLLSLGTNPNLRLHTDDKSDGETPLFEAVRSGNIRIVRLLLKYGADATVRRHCDNAKPQPVGLLYQDKKILDLLKDNEKHAPIRRVWLNARMFIAKQKQRKQHKISYPHKSNHIKGFT